MAGRAIGYVQAALMSLGFFMFGGFMLRYMVSSLGALKRFMLTGIPEDPTSLYQPWAWVLWLGIGLSTFAWVWSMVSSLLLLRQTPAIDGPPRIQ